MSDDLVGQTILGKYRVEGVIGSGGMGTVFDARDLRLDRQVAVKVLTASSASFGDVGRRFRREARALGQVAHANLVTLLEYDLLEDGTPAIVMERVFGRSLRELLGVHPFTVAEVHRILYQSLAALAVCHDSGLVHRDLKPDNIMIETRDGKFHVKIIDFGLTKLIADEGATALTLQGEVFGSPRFMAPEQWFRQTVDGRTDLYALGCIGYCMLLGHHFIPPGNPIAVCQSHMRGERPPITRTFAGEPVPKELGEAVRRAASADIEDRWLSARAMLEAMAGEPSATVPPPPTRDPDTLDTFDGEDTARVEGPDLAHSVFNQKALIVDAALFDTESEGEAGAIPTPAPHPSQVETQAMAVDMDRTLLDDGAFLRQVIERKSAPPPPTEILDDTIESTPAPRTKESPQQVIRRDEFERALRESEELATAPARRPKHPWLVPTLTGGFVAGALLLWLLLTR